jgi:hypothetical protein
MHVTARIAIACVIVTAAGTARQAGAVIVAQGNGSQNTSAPNASQWPYPSLVNAIPVPWNNVIQRGVGGSVYLGNRWMISAGHVGAGGINIGGTGYNVVPGSNITLTDPGSGQGVDLVLWKLDADPGLPAISITTTAPLPGSPVMMVGFGFNRASTSLVQWDRNWITVPSGGVASGYFADPNSSGKRWGTNNIMSVFPGGSQVTAVPNGSTTMMFATQFDNLVNEGQGINGDSGGAVFDTQGRLQGIMLAIFTYSGQPANSVVFGQATAIADLSRYRRQIEFLTGAPRVIPEPGIALLGVAGAGLLLRRRR